MSEPLFISASFLERLETCPRSAEYYKLRNRIASGCASGLVFGGILHKALELHYRQSEFNTSKEVLEQKISTLLEQEFSVLSTPPDDHRTLNWAFEIYQHYAARHMSEEIKPLRWAEPVPCKQCKAEQPECLWCNGTGKQSIMTELSFAFELYQHKGTPVIYHGFIDLPVRRGTQNFVVDYKTTSMLGQSFWDDKRMSAQQRGYAYAFNRLTGLPVSGYIVRSIRTAGMPPSIRDGKANRKGEVKSQSTWWEESFGEETYYLDTEDLAEWHTNTISLCEEFFWHRERNYFPRKTQWCSGKFGRCQYFDVCSSRPQDRELMLTSGLYKDKEPRELAQ